MGIDGVAVHDRLATTVDRAAAGKCKYLRGRSTGRGSSELIVARSVPPEHARSRETLGTRRHTASNMSHDFNIRPSCCEHSTYARRRVGIYPAQTHEYTFRCVPAAENSI